jgi:hypothetical protein
VQDTDWTELPIGGGDELRAADWAGARFLLRRSQLFAGFLLGSSRFRFHSNGPLSAAIDARLSVRFSWSASPRIELSLTLIWNPLWPNSNGTAKKFHCFSQRLHLLAGYYEPDVKWLPGLVRYANA